MAHPRQKHLAGDDASSYSYSIATRLENSMTTSPANFLNSLATARCIVAHPDQYKPYMVADARRVVAYWARRNAKRLAKK